MSLTAAVLLFAGGIALAKEYREFGNADGTAKFPAALVDVQMQNGKMTAVLERADTKKVLHVPVDLFREEDQKYIRNEGQRFALGRGLQVTITATKGKASASTPTGRRVSTHEEGFSIKVRNGAPLAAEGVTASYKIVWRKDVRVNPNVSRKEERRESGSLDLGVLNPKQEFAGTTSTVSLTSDRANPG